MDSDDTSHISKTSPSKTLVLAPIQRQVLWRVLRPWEKKALGCLILLGLLSGIYIAKHVSNAYSVNVPTAGGTIREGVVGIPR